jgi:hypothetical protein
MLLQYSYTPDGDAGDNADTGGTKDDGNLHIHLLVIDPFHYLLSNWDFDRNKFIKRTKYEWERFDPCEHTPTLRSLCRMQDRLNPSRTRNRLSIQYLSCPHARNACAFIARTVEGVGMDIEVRTGNQDGELADDVTQCVYSHAFEILKSSNAVVSLNAHKGTVAIDLDSDPYRRDVQQRKRYQRQPQHCRMDHAQRCAAQSDDVSDGNTDKELWAVSSAQAPRMDLSGVSVLQALSNMRLKQTATTEGLDDRREQLTLRGPSIFLYLDSIVGASLPFGFDVDAVLVRLSINTCIPHLHITVVCD